MQNKKFSKSVSCVQIEFIAVETCGRHGFKTLPLSFADASYSRALTARLRKNTHGLGVLFTNRSLCGGGRKLAVWHSSSEYSRKKGENAFS